MGIEPMANDDDVEVIPLTQLPIDLQRTANVSHDHLIQISAPDNH